MGKNTHGNHPKPVATCPEAIIAMDEAIKARAISLQIELAEDLEKWAESHGIEEAGALKAIAEAAFIDTDGRARLSAHPAIISRITKRVLDRITNIK